MADINQVLLEGRVADEPDVKQTNSGKTVANITIATTSKVGDNEYTNFQRCVAWGYDAEDCRNLNKGDLVSLRGRISNSNYMDRDGNKRYKTEVVAESVALVRRKRSAHPNDQDKEPSPVAPKGPPRETFPFSDKKNGINWPKPNDEGYSFVTELGKQLCIAWIDDKKPTMGGTIFELSGEKWEVFGEVQQDADLPF
tara:strand:- start:16058 stop:16648 length:591 start_codon:yes stop_codon:yes gene_type:complete